MNMIKVIIVVAALSVSGASAFAAFGIFQLGNSSLCGNNLITGANACLVNGNGDRLMPN